MFCNDFNIKLLMLGIFAIFLCRKIFPTRVVRKFTRYCSFNWLVVPKTKFLIKWMTTFPYKEALLDYMLCGYRLQFHFPSQSLLFTPNPSLYMPMSPCSLPHCHLFTPILSYGFVPLSVVPSFQWGGVGGGGLEGGVDLNGWVCAGVCDAILEQNIYCAKPNPETDTHSGSQVCKGLGAWSPQSNLDCDLATAIAIRPLTQLVACKMGSSILAAMSWLKVASTTSASLLTIPSINRTNGEECFGWL